MSNKEFLKYVYEKRIEGMSDSQIARSLAMSLAHFLGELNKAEKTKGAFFEPEKETKPDIPKNADKKKKVSGFGESESVKPPFQGDQKKPEIVTDNVGETADAAEPETAKEDLSWMED